MKFDLEYFKNNKVAINCETEDEAKELFEILKEYGLKWSSLFLSVYSENTENTCYTISEDLDWAYADVKFYEEDTNYEIIKFKDINL